MALKQTLAKYRLTFAMLAIVAAVVTGFVKLGTVAADANEAAKESRRVAAVSRKFAAENRRLLVANKRLIESQARAIRFSCDLGYVTADLVLGAIVLVREPPHSPSDREFIARFLADRAQLLDNLTSENSPCNLG